MARGSKNGWIGTTFRQETQQETEPLVGFRLLCHNVGLDLLESPMIRNNPWKPGEIQEAVCKKQIPGITGKLASGHLTGVVDADCMCGLYAFIDCKPPEKSFLFSVTVITQNWGKTQIHPTGYRSQYARIIGIVKPDDTHVNIQEWLNRLTKMSPVSQAIIGAKKAVDEALKGQPDIDMAPTLERMAKVYGVPLVPIAQAEAFAREYGHLISKEEIAAWKEEEDAVFLKSTRLAIPKLVMAVMLYLFVMVHQWLLDIDLFEWGDGVIDVIELLALIIFFAFMYTYVKRQARLSAERKEVQYTKAAKKKVK